MKLTGALLALALALAIAAGVLYRSAAHDTVADGALQARIRRLPAEFLDQSQGQRSFALSDLPQWEVDPALVASVEGCPEEGPLCDGDGPRIEVAGERAKVALWRRFVAGSGVELPKDYFRKAPFVHPSGHSYAALALVTRPETFRRPEWWREHKALLRVSELAKVAAGRLPLSEAEQLASQLQPDELRALRADTALLIAPRLDLLLLRRETGREAKVARYALRSLADWRRFLAGTPFAAEPTAPGARCLAVVGGLCFRSRAAYAEGRLAAAGWSGLGSLGVLALAVVLGVVRRIRSRRREQQARLLVLQTLTHELRTPVTTLQLSLEPMRRSFDELPEGSQEAFLRMCDAVQRLQRVIEASKQYLQGHVDGQVVRLREAVVPSIAELVEGIVDSYDEEVRLEVRGADMALQGDPYWLGTCIRNLVDNALQHGAAPVEVTVIARDADLDLIVQDAGDAGELSFAEMTAPFGRRDGSEGIGLGLAVVERLVRSMGGALRFAPDPTRFTFSLSNVRVDG